MEPIIFNLEATVGGSPKICDEREYQIFLLDADRQAVAVSEKLLVQNAPVEAEFGLNCYVHLRWESPKDEGVAYQIWCNSLASGLRLVDVIALPYTEYIDTGSYLHDVGLGYELAPKTPVPLATCIKKLQDEIYALVAETDTREDAIAIKDALMRPIGSLNSKFSLFPQRCLKCSSKKKRTKALDMKSSNAYTG